MQVIIVICLQVALCCACAAGALVWRETVGEQPSWVVRFDIRAAAAP